MNINELLEEEIKNTFDDTEQKIINYIFQEIENDQYINDITLGEKILEQIDQRLEV